MYVEWGAKSKIIIGRVLITQLHSLPTTSTVTVGSPVEAWVPIYTQRLYVEGKMVTLMSVMSLKDPDPTSEGVIATMSKSSIPQ